MKRSILITVEESSFYMIKHLNLARFESRAGTQEWSAWHTHTFDSRVSREQILNTQGETESLNGPKSVVGPFDEIRRVGKASGVEP